MAKIKIENLSKNVKINAKELGYIAGGWGVGLNNSFVQAPGGGLEMESSFNLQYFMLQNKISHENRQFTMISNIMKTKHDTAKNAINNIR